MSVDIYNRDNWIQDSYFELILQFLSPDSVTCQDFLIWLDHEGKLTDMFDSWLDKVPGMKVAFEQFVDDEYRSYCDRADYLYDSMREDELMEGDSNGQESPPSSVS